ncbi:aspartate aminotransferase [Chromatiales bacterium (ex Bugula neritina AB1)]|nr:aspartate aminotransferase [Chromatiales bacterium (ex Bugula neritina AB1)]
MAIKLSAKLAQVKPSPTMAVTALAADLRAQGRDVIGLGAGEPDFDTPAHIKQAAIEAINNGETKYTAVDGIVPLKEAIIDKFKGDNGLSYEKGEILVSCGGKQSFYNLAQAVLDVGDEVVIPAPYWVSYPDIVLLAGATPVFVQTSQTDAFKITPEQLDQAITPATRMIVINSPSNPSGKSYTRDELTALGEVLKRYPDVIIATDDMYEHIVWADHGFCNIVNACPGLHDRTVVLNGVSKAYAMTGWRIGYAGGPEPVIAAMRKIQSQSTSNPTSVSQWASTAALTGGKDCIAEMLTAFEQRHNFVVKSLNEMNGVDCIEGDGTFYAFPNVQAAIDANNDTSNDVEFSSWVLDKAGVAVVPGSAFGTEGHVRLSFATSMENLQKAMQRMGDLING